MQGICAIRKLFSGPVDVVRVLAAVDTAAVPDRVGGQIFGPGMVARGIEVDAVLRGVVVDLAAVGRVGQGLADVDIVAALAQRHVGQQQDDDVAGEEVELRSVGIVRAEQHRRSHTVGTQLDGGMRPLGHLQRYAHEHGEQYGEACQCQQPCPYVLRCTEHIGIEMLYEDGEFFIGTDAAHIYEKANEITQRIMSEI